MAFLELDNGRLYFEVIDMTAPWVEHPETILFHHGVSTTCGIWAEWLPQLADRYRIVRFDMRGFGRSSQAAGDDTEWTMDSMMADALAVAAAAGVERFHCVGESVGGTIAMALAIRHPERLRTLTASNAAHRGVAVQNIRGQWESVMAEDGQQAWADEMMTRRFFPEALSSPMRAWFEREQATCSASATLALANLLLETDLAPDIGRITVPTLLLCPDASPFIPVALMADLHAGLPDSEMHVVAHSRHGLPFSHGPECGRALRNFLDRHSGR